MSLDDLAAGQLNILYHIDTLYTIAILMLAGGLVALLVVGFLAAWSVQVVTHDTRDRLVKVDISLQALLGAVRSVADLLKSKHDADAV